MQTNAPQQESKTSILFTEVNESVLEPSFQALRETGYEVYLEKDASKAPGQCATGRFNVVVTGSDDIAKNLDIIDQVKEAAPKVKPIILAAGNNYELIKSMVNRSYPDNVIPQTDPFDTPDLLITIQKLLTGDIFGLKKYLREPDKEGHIRICKSKDKEKYVEEILDVASEAGAKSRITQHIADVLDELIMNAIYDAPVHENGAFKYADWERTKPVELPDEESAVLSYAVKDSVLAISMADPHGSLPRKKVYTYLDKCFAQGDSMIEQKSGGAGLGLYKIFEAISTFIINIHKNHKTEIITTFDLRKSVGKFRRQDKKFHIFSKEA